MTDVGSVSVGVVVHGDGLGQKLAATIRAAVLPVIRDLNRELAQTNRRAKDVDGSGFVKLSASARAAAMAVREVGTAHREVDRIAAVSHRNQIRGYDRVADAAERSARRQIDAMLAVAAVEAGTPNGSSGGGGPPIAGGGGRRRRGGGLLGYLLSPAGMNALAAASTLLNPTALGIAEVTKSIVELGGAGLALPAMFAGIASSVSVAAIAFAGTGDAVKDMWTAMASGDPKDIEKANKSLEKLAPNARAAVKAFTAFQPAIHAVTQELQNVVFDGLDQSISKFIGRTLPTFLDGTRQIAGAWNETIKTLLDVGGSDSTKGIFEKIFGNTAVAQREFNKAIEPLVHGIGTLTAEGSDFLPRISKGFTELSTRFDTFITNAAADGRLDQWIDKGFRAFADLGESLLNIGKIITDITGSLGDGQTFLGWLREATGDLHEFLSSVEGQEKLSNFFEGARETWGELQPILADLLRVVGEIISGFQTWGEIILPIIGGIADGLSDMPGLVTGMVTAWLGISSLKSLGSILGIGSVISQMRSLPIEAQRSAGGIRNAFKGPGLLPALAIGGSAAILGDQLIRPEDGSDPSALAALGGAGLNIGAGALIGGQIAGPVGVAVGGFIGAVVSILETAKRDLDEGRRKFEEYRDFKDTPEERQKHDEFLRTTGRDVIETPSLLTPNINEDLRARITSGAIKGYTINPDGSVVNDATGEVLPGLNLQPGPAYADSSANPGGVPRVVTPPVPKTTTVQLDVPKAELPPVGLGASVATPQFDEALNQLRSVASEITNLPEGEIRIKDPSPEVLENLGKVDAKIEDLGNNEIKVKADTKEAQAVIDNLVRRYKSQQIRLQVTANVPTVAPSTSGGSGWFGGRADGGVLPGYSPGVDNMLVPMSGGEGVLIPEAVRGLGGPNGIYAINSLFRHGLSRRGYAGGGVIGFQDGGVSLGPGIPTAIDGMTELSVLIQIRDILSGRVSGPLTQTSDATGMLEQGLTGPSGLGGLGGPMGPGGLNGQGYWADGTPRNPGYEMASAAIAALGGDPMKFLGPNPALMSAGPGGGGLYSPSGGLGALGGGAINAAALQSFARSGNTRDLAGTGLDPADPVVRAIVTARNKKRNNLGTDTIAELVGDVVGGGGFSGVLDSSNSTLIAALQRYRDKGMRQSGGGGSSVFPSSFGGGSGLIGLAQQASGGKYQYGASDLASGLSDCSGAVSDLVELVTKGQATAGRLFSTSDAASVLPGLGAVPGLVPGTLQIGFNAGHMAATLPNGVNFESGGGTGQGATYGGNAAGAADPQFTQQFSLPVGDMAGFMGGFGGGGNPLGYGGSPVPVYIVNGPGGGGGMGGLGGLLGDPLGAVGDVAGSVGSDVLGAALGTGDRALPTDPVSLHRLANEGNPNALFALMGYKIGDYNRTGGEGGPLERNEDQFTPDGRLFSDTGALTDRTFTSAQAAEDARTEQLLDASAQIRDQLSEQLLQPILEKGVAGGINSIDMGQASAIGTAMGQAAAGPIASAVASAVPSSSGAAPAIGAEGIVNGVEQTAAAALGGGFADGGPVIGPGSGTSDSILARVSNGEYIVPARDVARAGGFAGMDAFRRSLPGFATGGGVIANDYVGADFFGVSEIPFVGVIVNALIKVLLLVLGIQIEERDTLNELTDEARAFRGDFKKFDATGRLFSDTSGLVDRTSTSEQAAADERVRILKIVIQELIKYLIEKVWVPIGKAVANTAIQAGAAAAGAAINTQAPGAGGIVSSVISSAGTAGVDIVADVWGAIAVEAGSVIVDVVGDLLQGALPDLVKWVFGGAFFAPLTALAGGAATTFDVFDEGGVATGVGLMPKATIEPERVLNPSNTRSFDLLPGAISDLAASLRNDRRKQVVIHAPFTVDGSARGAENAHARLLELMS